mmetsp:Transcript_64628/g.97373  ORF Transcript_64628/g.97373 Transcript_64628/m.97373 type:complete len:197 (+) Transcript_64628:62-652(+)
MSTPTKPTKHMSWDEFYQKTDNANKLMDRVWYCIACTDKGVADQKVFWEHWFWKEGDDDKELKLKMGQNHTKTVTVAGKELDYPIWPVMFTPESFKMYPAIDLKCFVIAPLGIGMLPVAFPENDSRTEFRVDYAEIFGSKMYFIFVLDPNISEENKKKCFEKLEADNGILREWFHDVRWEESYEIGSAGEPDINPK